MYKIIGKSEILYVFVDNNDMTCNFYIYTQLAIVILICLSTVIVTKNISSHHQG